MKKIILSMVLLVIFGLAVWIGYQYIVFSDWDSYMPHRYSGWSVVGMHSSFGLFRGLMMGGLFFGLVSLMIVFYFSNQGNTSNRNETLKKRLAKGEITLEQYHEIKQEMNRGH